MLPRHNEDLKSAALEIVRPIIRIPSWLCLLGGFILGVQAEKESIKVMCGMRMCSCRSLSSTTAAMDVR